ncbi:unnamed protein product [Bursaphelenchus okinawaensis]|uniref:F-box domain-containing protein n=1 Tax=Bursaphelenchus okinawaensis TaxID=465554 RepID=A0A811JQW5_9BILA|nr:unnamed protein product [Bursaphelenchus okinawaensis]CAG9078197.1 unnamed protein product [Bursaphelenchus okinawaensis]
MSLIEDLEDICWLFRYADLYFVENLWELYQRRSGTEIFPSEFIFNQPDIVKQFLYLNIYDTVRNVQLRSGWKRIFLNEQQKTHEYYTKKNYGKSIRDFLMERCLVLNCMMHYCSTVDAKTFARLVHNFMDKTECICENDEHHRIDTERSHEDKIYDNLLIKGLSSSLVCIMSKICRCRIKTYDDTNRIEQVYIPEKINSEHGSFLQHFIEILTSMVHEYHYVLSCNSCLSMPNCTFHDKTLRNFNKLPLLVKEMILRKLEGHDLASLRATSESTLALVDSIPRLKFIDTSVFHRPVHFWESQTLRWFNEYPSRHTKQKYSTIPIPQFLKICPLYPVNILHGVPKSKSQLEFCLKSGVEHLEMRVRSTEEYRQVMLDLFLNVEYLAFIQHISVQADEFLLVDESLKPPGFRLLSTGPFLLIFQRKEVFQVTF